MNKLTPLDYAKAACDSKMRMPAEALPPKGRFHYHAGVFLRGMQKTYELCGEDKYYDYVKKWVDDQISEDGNVKCYCKEHFDDLMAGSLLFMLDEKENDKRYKKALDLLVSALDGWKRNEKGGFWHKQDLYPNQVWLDGIFMYGPLTAEYDKTYGTNRFTETVNEQLNIMWDNMYEEKAGLLKHAWDCSLKAPWADKKTGRSPEFWGRAIGWYCAAIMDLYELMPEKYSSNLAQKEIKLINSLIKYQKPENGLWYQVVDKNNRPDNWPELSCSCLFIYAICKAYNLGLIDNTYMEYASKGYSGVVSMLKKDEDGYLIVGNVCIGTGVGDYEFYVKRPVCDNDLHGLGAFLYMATEYEKALRKYNN